MTTHYEDEEQIEQLRRWWRENRLPLISGLALGLAAIFSWQAWNRYQDSQAAQASHLFEDLRKAVTADKYADAVPMGDRLQNDFSKTPYAVDGALKLAQAAFDSGKLDDARSRLEWASAHAGDDGIRGLVRLRLARVLWQQAKPDDALKLLAPSNDSANGGGFAALDAELRGDILLDKGDRSGAHSAYADALKMLAVESPNRQGLQRKLDDLNDVAVNS